jgi:hypothetical protein
VYGLVFRQRLCAMGIRDKPTALRSPWQNPYVERLIGTIRPECLDHMIVFGEAHLRRILGRYAAYYNESPIHRSLEKNPPFHRAIERFGLALFREFGGIAQQVEQNLLEPHGVRVERAQVLLRFDDASSISLATTPVHVGVSARGRRLDGWIELWAA